MVGLVAGVRRNEARAVALFTVVTDEEKYKSKNLVDTVVYRGSDAASAWAHEGLVRAGLGPSGISLVGLPLAALSCVVALVLARQHASLARLNPGSKA